MRNEDGFTLIELLIVLGILAVLVGVVAMSVGNINETTQARAATSERAIVQTAVDAYIAQSGADRAGVDLTCAALGPRTEGIGKYLASDSEYTWSVVDGIVSDAPCTVP